MSHEGWSLKSLVICVWHWNLSDRDGKGHVGPGEYYVSWLLQVCTSCWLIVDATSMLIPKLIIYLVLWMCYLPYNRKKRCVWSLRLENESLTIVERTAKKTASVWSHCERRRDGASSFPAIHRLKQTFVGPPCALGLPAVTGYEHPLGIFPCSVHSTGHQSSCVHRKAGSTHFRKFPQWSASWWNRCLYSLLPGMHLVRRLENFLMISCPCSVVARGLRPSLWP